MLRSRSVREGSLGLFALLGLVLFAGVAVWLRGGQFGQQPYEFRVKFADISGLQVGAPVRFRGMTVGRVAQLRPQPDGVEVTLEIASTQLLIPRNSTIQTSRYGLIGEGSIEILPSEPLSEQAASLSPFPPKCQPALIICDGDQVEGGTGSQLVESLTGLGKSLGQLDVNNINGAIANVRVAAARMVQLSEDLSLLAKSSSKEIQGASKTLGAIEQAGKESSKLAKDLDSLILQNQDYVSQTLRETTQLMQSVNRLVNDNRGEISRTVTNIARTSEEVGGLASKLQVTADEINQTLAATDKEKIVRDLETLLANTAETSANLRQISATLNDPATLLTLQQTLDSARATFANAQKITADLDELTGDPAFRTNIRKLVNGLGSLVSSSDQLGQQVQTAQVLESLNHQIDYQIAAYERLAAYQREFNKTVERRSQESGVLDSRKN